MLLCHVLKVVTSANSVLKSCIQYKGWDKILEEDLSEEETEKYISDLVTKKTVYARIDRPAKVVNFEVKRGPDEVLDEWSGSMKGLLGLLERVGHLIQREEMMARIQPTEKETKKSVKIKG